MRLLKFLFIASPAAALAAVGAHYVLFDRYDYLAEAAVRDPENYCQTLFAEKNYRDLADYVAFYASVPGLTPTPAMEKLAEEAQAIRSDPSYIAKETNLRPLRPRFQQSALPLPQPVSTHRQLQEPPPKAGLRF